MPLGIVCASCPGCFFPTHLELDERLSSSHQMTLYASRIVQYRAEEHDTQARVESSAAPQVSTNLACIPSDWNCFSAFNLPPCIMHDFNRQDQYQ
jgi:hypothetical protein